MRVFVIAESTTERDIFKVALQRIGLEVVMGTSLDQVRSTWSHNWGYLILLAVDDPTGLADTVKQMRTWTRVPIMLVNDLVPEVDLCRILDAGADLVLQRPVSVRVLAGYVQVLLRRAEAVPMFVLPTLELGEIKLDPDTHTVTIADQNARHLTQLEFNLLYVLMTNPDQVIPNDIIVERVWGYSGRGDRELVRGLVSRLRQKLEHQDRKFRAIETVPGVGYRFSVDPT